MLVTITAYRGAMKIDGVDAPVAGQMIESVKKTADGTYDIPDECRLLRIATDTKIHIAFDGDATDTEPLVFANTVEYFGCHENETFDILTAA